MIHFLRKLPVQLLLLIPVLLYLTVALYWHARGIYLPAGDEPHYLLVADSIVRDRDLRVENNYQLDTPVQRAMKLKLYVPELMYLHVRNQFSMHNIGLPLLLALPYAVAGVLGAKIFMALLAGLWPLLLYQILLQLTGAKEWSVTFALALTTGLPFAGGSNQITPDLLAGLLVLYVTWRIILRLWDEERHQWSNRSLLWLGALTALLPWLHIKLIAPAAILLLALVYAGRRIRPERADAGLPPYLIPAALFACSVLLLAVYHHKAFGSIWGPYEQGRLSFHLKEVCMIFFGLHWDQAQGMFMQQPLLLLGLVGIIPLIRANWRAGLLLGALYLALVLPNSMHTAWYGGFSFAGRFGWTAAPLWVLPLAFAVKTLVREHRSLLLKLCVAGSVALQVWLAAKWLVHDSILIIERVPVWANRSLYDDTGLLLALPSFRDFDLYLKQPPNYVFVAAGVLLVISGWLWLIRHRGLIIRLWIPFAVIGLAALTLLPTPAGSLIVEPYKQPRVIGNNDGLVRVATERDGAGTLLYGPYVQLLEGVYEIKVEYESAGTPEPVVGHFDVVYSPGVRLVGEAGLPPSETNGGTFKYRFPVREPQSLASYFEFRIWYPGHGTLRVKNMMLAPVSLAQ